MMDYDWEAMRIKQVRRDRLLKLGKHCPKCVFYRTNTESRKGGCKGFCLLRKADYPEKPMWWGASMKDVCERFEEDKA